MCAVDHFDLEKKINCLLSFCVGDRFEDESLDISIELHTETRQKNISVRWCIPKLFTDWDEKRCVEYSKDRLYDLRSSFSDGFAVEPYRTIIVGDNIWLYCHIITVTNQESTSAGSD